MSNGIVTITKGSKAFDKFELSPNSLARCHKCNQKIYQNHLRVGIRVEHPPPPPPLHREHHYGHQSQRSNSNRPWWWYYHEKCCTNEQIQNLNLNKSDGMKRKEFEESTIDITSTCSSHEEREKQLRYKRQKLVYENRGLLREDLKALRIKLANESRVPPYMIFQDITIDSIVENMPCTKSQLIECYGIGYWKANRYSGSILQVVNQYRKQMYNSTYNIPPEAIIIDDETKTKKKDEQDHDHQNCDFDSSLNELDNDDEMSNKLGLITENRDRMDKDNNHEPLEELDNYNNRTKHLSAGIPALMKDEDSYDAPIH